MTAAHKHHRPLIAGFALFAGLLHLPAQAQTEAQAQAQTDVPTIAVSPTPATPMEPSAERPVSEIQEIIVTSRRRSESAEKVPISLTVLDGDALAEAGLFRPQDIQERVPGLVVSVPNARLTSYTIRGLGSSSANDGLESSVGLFLDGVYLGRQGLSVFDLVDLERVEVLRGPQGTLFGKNTTAGAFNIVTKLPTPEFEAKAEGSVGNFGYQQLRGSINGSLLGDTLSGRLTGYLTRRDGLLTNLYDGSKLNDQHREGLRGQLLWNISDNATSRFILEYGRTDEKCCAFPLTLIRDTIAQRDAYMEYEREPADPFARVVQDDSPIFNQVRQTAASNEINWTLADDLKLTSISAWRHWRFTPFNDDATTMQLIPLTGVINDHTQLSQELRLQGKWRDDVDWLGGLYFIQQDLDSRERNVLGKDIVPWVFGGIIRSALPFATKSNTGPLLDLLVPGENVAGTTIYSNADQRSRSSAAFGSVDWHITPVFDATLGLRYTYEDKRATVNRRRDQPQTGGSVDPNNPAALPGGLLEILGLTDPRNLYIDVVLDQIAGGDYARATRRNEGELSGQFALGWQIQPNVRGYFTAARGYKGGGINLGVIGPSVGETFEPETATSLEVGVKSNFFKRRLSLNVAVYNTEVRDYQALTFDNEQTLIPNPRQVNILNVGRVRLRGAEVESQAKLSYGLSLRVGVAYSDAVTLDFTNAPDEDDRTNTKDLSGERLFNAPRWTGTAGVDHNFDLSQHLSVYSGADYSYRSGYYNTVEHGGGSETEAYSLVNLRLGLRHDRGYEIGLWVRNLFDRDYIAAINPIYGVGDYGAIPSDPRTYGVTLRAEFH